MTIQFKHVFFGRGEQSHRAHLKHTYTVMVYDIPGWQKMYFFLLTVFGT